MHFYCDAYFLMIGCLKAKHTLPFLWINCQSNFYFLIICIRLSASLVLTDQKPLYVV